MQHHLLLVIAEIHAVEHNAALQPAVAYGTVRSVWVFPRPYPCALLAFGDGSVCGDICVDKFNVPIVRF